MQGRRSTAVGPLHILLPHPSLRRQTSSSMLSPRTPSSLATTTSPSAWVQPTASRKSTDSWSSSIDERDNLLVDWSADQILLLTRTLDALPAHLITPFNGPVPPNNLLDKIARGISDAKGVDWPHSIRATRRKLAEISRASMTSNTIPEENQGHCHFSSPANTASPQAHGRRPLYRQSSMDFMNVEEAKQAQTDRIDRASSRLQRTDRLVASPYHTRSVSRRASIRSNSPTRPLSLATGPSTASSTTLASMSSNNLRPSLLRRSMSGYTSATSSTCASSDRMSVASIESCIAAVISSTDSLPLKEKDLARVQRSDSFATPCSTHGVKRAPSYGAMAQEAKTQGRSASPCSSDEEEKERSRTAVKKARTKTSKDVTGGQTLQPGLDAQTAEKKSVKKRPPMNPQRNPSMFGFELPKAPISATYNSPPPCSPAPSLTPGLLSSPDITSSPPRTLRRVKRLPVSSINVAQPLGRKISFSVLPTHDPASPILRKLPTDRPSLGRLGSAFKLS